MIMDETLISLETAKLAKEKGFNEPTRGFIEPVYNETHEFFDDTVLYVYSGYKPLKEHHKILEEGWYLAPTQALLQKWIREKHKIHIDIGWQPFGENLSWWFLTSKLGEEIWEFETLNNFDTYEEALEAGLYEALTLLK